MQFKTLAAAALVAVLAVPAMPSIAMAGDAEITLLGKYAGTWKGTGNLTGDNAGNLDCRITFKQSGAKLTYNGRCGLDKQGSQSFSGAIAYNDQANRYEARSSGSPVSIGKKSGGGVVFVFDGTDTRGSMKSTLSLTGGTIKFQFSGKDATSGEEMKGSVSFKKS